MEINKKFMIIFQVIKTTKIGDADIYSSCNYKESIYKTFEKNNPL